MESLCPWIKASAVVVYICAVAVWYLWNMR